MHARPALTHVELPSPAARAWPRWAWIAGGGTALALADLVFAAAYWFLHSGTSPMRIPQSIAAWVLGTPARAQMEPIRVNRSARTDQRNRIARAINAHPNPMPPHAATQAMVHSSGRSCATVAAENSGTRMRNTNA